MMKKQKKIDYFCVVKNDILFLKKTVHSIIPGIVGNINLIVDDENHVIGTNIGSVKSDFYYQDHVIISSENKYVVSLFDGSLICAFYDFDIEGNISSFSLSFLPSIESKQLFNKVLNHYSGEYYLRIDYKPDTYVENTHPKIHAHLSLNKNDIRIPVDKFVLVSEFLYFVLKNIYGISDNMEVFYNKICENKNGITFDCLLSNSELSSLYLTNNN